MEINLTKDQSDALAIAAVDQKSTSDVLVQAVVDDYTNQLVYKYLIPVADRLVALQAQVDELTKENADLKAKLGTN